MLSMPGTMKPKARFYGSQHEDSYHAAFRRLAEDPPLGGEVRGERAQHAEYGAAGARADRYRVQHVAGYAAGQPRDHVDQREPGVPVRALDERAEYEKSEAVERQVHQADVEEYRREQAPVLALGDKRSEHGAEVEQHLPVLAAPRRGRGRPDEHVDGQQRPGHERPPRQARRRWSESPGLRRRRCGRTPSSEYAGEGRRACGRFRLG